MIKIIGVGGAGGKAVDAMVAERLEGIEFIACNTDAQTLKENQAKKKILIGQDVSHGLGSGSNPEIGREAVLQSIDNIASELAGADMIFVIAGMGGGTGTGGAPVVAEIAKSSGALTIGVASIPFFFEGARRRQQAELGIAEFKKVVDTLIVIPNQNLLLAASENIRYIEAYKLVDQAMLLAVRSISDLVILPGMINIDFADIRSVLQNQSISLMGFGYASGEHRAIEAMQTAIFSLCFGKVDLRKALGLLINITGFALNLIEINEAVSVAISAVDPQIKIIFGSINDEQLGDKIRITVIAIGFLDGIKDLLFPSLSHHSLNAIPPAFNSGRGFAINDSTVPSLSHAPNFDDVLDIPSFIRNKQRPQPQPHEQPEDGFQSNSVGKAPIATELDVWSKSYALFNVSGDSEARAETLKSFRDLLLHANTAIDQKTVEPITWKAIEPANALWRLASTGNTAEFVGTMMKLLRGLPVGHPFKSLATLYEFLEATLKISSVLDSHILPLDLLEQIRGMQVRDWSGPQSVQFDEFAAVVKLFSEDQSPKLLYSHLCEADLRLSKMSWRSSTQQATPEEISLGHVANYWHTLVLEALRLTLIDVRCDLVSYHPIYVNRWNDVRLRITGGPFGELFSLVVPQGEGYDARLDCNSGVFQPAGTEISLNIKAQAPGKLTLTIGILQTTHLINLVALVENPFVAGAPLTSQDMFVGRTDLLERIMRGLVSSTPTNFIIVGRRRIGKTSLLYAVKRQLPKSVLAPFVSTEIIGTTPHAVCQAIASQIEWTVRKEVLSEQKIPSAVFEPVDPCSSFMKWLDQIHNYLVEAHIKCLVLLIDEASEIVHWDLGVQRLLRYLFSNIPWVRGVLAASPDMMDKLTTGVSSPLYNIFTTLRMGPLSREESRQLICVPLQLQSIPAQESLADIVYDFTGGIPYYIQAVGYELIENFHSAESGDEDWLMRSLVHVKQHLETSYPVTLRNLPPEEKLALITINHGRQVPEASVRRLKKHDLIVFREGRWTVSALIEQQWIEEYEEQLEESAAEELWARYGDKFDLVRLGSELHSIEEVAGISKEIRILITDAGRAAEKGDGSKVMKCLGKVGKWTLDTATKIGTDIAVAAIKVAYGLK